MKIAMFTNVYPPHEGAQASAVDRFARELESKGNQILIVAPPFDQGNKGHQEESTVQTASATGENEESTAEAQAHLRVLRTQALTNLMGSDLSLPTSEMSELSEQVAEFDPDIIHAYQPLFLGETALVIGSRLQKPVVATHQNLLARMKEQLPDEGVLNGADSQKRMIQHANLCHGIVAPTQTVADSLRQGGVQSKIQIIPTGVDIDDYGKGDGAGFRPKNGIGEEDFVFGHVGRLDAEKNLHFLTEAVARALQELPEAHFLLVGDGGLKEELGEFFRSKGLEERVHMPGLVQGQDLIDSYAAMDLFTFAGQWEIQGMSLAKALAASLPIVALRAPGAQDIVQPGINGELIDTEDAELFAQSLIHYGSLTLKELWSQKRKSRRTANPYDTALCTGKLFSFYKIIIRDFQPGMEAKIDSWQETLATLDQNSDTDKQRATTLLKILSSDS